MTTAAYTQSTYPSFIGYVYSGQANPNWDYTWTQDEVSAGYVSTANANPQTALECANVVAAMTGGSNGNHPFHFAIFSHRSTQSCGYAWSDYTTGNGGNSAALKEIFDSGIYTGFDITTARPNYFTADGTLPGLGVSTWYIWDYGSFVTMDLRSAYSGGSSSSGSSGDPHVRFAHGGRGDFRGRNDTYFSLLSAPGVHVAAKTVNTDFLLPAPRLVHGSFFTDIAFRVRGNSEREYGITSRASSVSFAVHDIATGRITNNVTGIWKQWWEDGVRVYYKQSTVYVRARGWEVNATRHPIYNYISGPSRWRFDLRMRKLDSTPFVKFHGSSSKTCFPHGLIGQSYDGDRIALHGKLDAYDAVEFTTSAQLEGAIEGSYEAYAMKSAFDATFAYSRYDIDPSDACAPRNVSAIKGARQESQSVEEIAGSDE